MDIIPQIFIDYARDMNDGPLKMKGQFLGSLRITPVIQKAKETHWRCLGTIYALEEDSSGSPTIIDNPYLFPQTYIQEIAPND